MEAAIRDRLGSELAAVTDIELVIESDAVVADHRDDPAGLYPVLEAVVREHDPDGVPLPAMAPYATDAKHLLDLGVPTFGFSPMRQPPDETYLEPLARGRRARVPRGPPLGPARPLRCRPEVLRMTFSTRARRLGLAAGTTLVLAFVRSPRRSPLTTRSTSSASSSSPPQITVAIGDTVTWEVTESIGSPHSVTSGAPGGPDIGAEFDSGDDGLAGRGRDVRAHLRDGGDVRLLLHRPRRIDERCRSSSRKPARAEAPARRRAGANAVERTAERSAGHPREPRDPSPRRDPCRCPRRVCFGAAAVWRRMNPA